MDYTFRPSRELAPCERFAVLGLQVYQFVTTFSV